MCRLAIIFRVFRVKSASIQDKFNRLIYVDVIKFACCWMWTFMGITVLEMCGFLRFHALHLFNKPCYPYITQIRLSANS
jgi:hypothetical protein